MSVTRTSVKRPLTIIMIFIVLIMFGGIGYMKMPADIMPEIDIPVVTVTTKWNGAGPEDIDEEISQKIEKALSSVSNVKETSAQSAEGVSNVTVQFEYGTDVDEIMNTIRSKVDAVTATLPSDVDKPSVQKLDIMGSQAIAYLVVEGKGNVTENDKMGYAQDTVQDKLEAVDGVNSAEITGGDETEINVVADPAVLSSYGITIDTISGVLSTANKSTPYGSISQGDQSIVIRGVNKIKSLEDIRALQIPTGSGTTVSLDTICSVDYGVKEKETYLRYNGKLALAIQIFKQQDGNTVKVMQGVRKAVDELNSENTSYNIILPYDSSEYINNSIRDVIKNLALSAFIAFIVILMFLKSGRASFVVAVAIPTSIIGAVAMLYFTGETINMVTLSSLVIAVGMVVDNSIVVIENIFKYRQSRDLQLDEAAIKGTETVSNAVLASTLTTVAIFLPILFTEGFTKIMFGALAKTLIFALTFSLIVAVTLVPSIFNKLSGGKNAEKMKEKETPLFNKISYAYQRLLTLALKHKIIVVLISLGMFVGSIVLVSLGLIGMDFMDNGDQGMVQVEVRVPEGLGLDATEKYVEVAESKIKDLPELDEILAQTEEGTGYLILMLSPSTERERSSEEIEVDVANRLKTVPDCEINVSGASSSESGSVTIKIKGPDKDVLEEIAKQAEANIKSTSKFRNIKTTVSDGKEEVQFKIDRRKAQEYGINISGIGSTLRTAISGSDAANVTIDGDTMDVNLQFKDASVDSVADVEQIKIMSTNGQQIPLSAFAHITIAKSVKSVSRSDGDYSITISAKADNIDTNKANAIAMEQIEKVGLPKNYGLDVGGTQKQMMESMSGLIFAIIVAIILVYMVMVAQFESFAKPFIIMFCIPFAFVGVVLGLLITRISLNVVGMLGAILLVGIVVNNGIVLIDYIEQLRQTDLVNDIPLDQLVAKGSATRLRPVLMTTLTTILGMIPSALAFGEGGDMMQPLSVVVIGGLTVSTLITLILIPTIYLIFEKIQNSIGRVLSKITGKISGKIDNFKEEKIKPKMSGIFNKNIDSKDNVNETNKDKK